MKNKKEIIDWANSKGLIKPESIHPQIIKIMEELGELASATLKKDREAQIDAYGDLLITIIISAEQNGLDIEECLESAYNVIKNRTGVTKNGTFYKD